MALLFGKCLNIQCIIGVRISHNWSTCKCKQNKYNMHKMGLYTMRYDKSTVYSFRLSDVKKKMKKIF